VNAEDLSRINREFTGIVCFNWDSLPYPLYLRSGSTDFRNFVQIFQNGEYDFPMPFTPRTVLDLGAYIGFAAIFLAHRFPDAEIVCVEPSASNFRLLTLNTGAYPNIRCINAGVWGESSPLQFSQYTPGDWGMHLTASAPDGDSVPGLSLPAILERIKWSTVDLLKCDIEGAEREVFATARPLISTSVNCCAIELHEQAAPGATAAVAGCFSNAAFEYTRSGEYHVYMRRDRTRAALHVPGIHVLRPAAGLRQINLKNVPPQPWGYYTFNATSCQLNATKHTDAPAELHTLIEFSGQCQFDATVMVENPRGHGVFFSVAIHNPANEELVVEASTEVAANEKIRWTVPVRPLEGAYRVTLRTRMAQGSPTNHQVRSYWLDPRFLGGTLDAS
jgi:FkbM family methyltransferase